jgi:hypothetical protein
MGAVLQLVAPLAVPDPPVELDHVTFVTPTLSLAVPLTMMLLADVETLVLAGDAIVSDGAVVSGPLGGGVGGAGFGALGCVRLTATVWTTEFCCASRAVIVMRLSPTFSGIAEMVQFEEPCAVPEDP